MINRVIFIGSKWQGLKFLKTIYKIAPRQLRAVITIDDTGDSRSAFSEFKTFCRKKIALFVVKDKEHFNNTIYRLRPELCFVCGWYWIIENELLEFVPHGFIGIHFSKLPAYRGGSPLVWAMIRGERSIGVSFFQLTKEIDEGNLWGQGSVLVKKTDYIGDVLKKLEQKTIALLKKNYLKILEEKIVSTPQEFKNVSYFPPRSPKDGKIDWQCSSVDIFNFIKAQSQPYPGAFTFHNGMKVVVWKAALLKKTTNAPAGEIIGLQKNKVFVSCGDRKVMALTKTEIAPGQRRVSFSIKDRFHS